MPMPQPSAPPERGGQPPDKEFFTVDYKNVRFLQRYLSERGKIMPRRLTGLSRRGQRELAQAIKRARQLALLPYTND